MKQAHTEQWSALLHEWVESARPHHAQGRCADYIPALAQANPANLGICLLAADGTLLRAGEWDVPFTMQSISKVISFITACMERGISRVTESVDVEPTGDAFNSIVRLENRPGKPFNPLINAGAITVASLLPGATPADRLECVLGLLERIIGNRPTINEQVYRSEWDSAHRNRALAHYLKELGYLESTVDEALEVYFKLCSIEVNTSHLAEIGLTIACDGLHPLRGQAIIPKEVARISKALMLTCGMYNASGKYAAYVGVPAKSGVSGGIMATVPPRVRDEGLPFLDGCGIGIFGPAVDDSGNSAAGGVLLKQVANQWDLSIF
ncbi:glutaminase [Brevibacillus sp. B_LB10_24]|uniref:glutaminase n=1 Tax=Brevibacillus sp. B_LB10_24 TaxID=3380645 RepID=UPI0038BBC8DD